MLSWSGRSTTCAINATAAAVFRPIGSPTMLAAGMVGTSCRTRGVWRASVTT